MLVCVWRFEDVEGRGMDNASQVACDLLCDDLNHPDLWLDETLCMALYNHNRAYAAPCTILEKYISNFLFGFGSLEQLHKWMYRKDILTLLHNDGIVISEYYCKPEDVVMGGTQAIFCGHVERESFSILEYFNLA